MLCTCSAGIRHEACSSNLRAVRWAQVSLDVRRLCTFVTIGLSSTMSSESVEPIFSPLFWNRTLRALGALLIILAIVRTRYDFHVVGLYAPPNAQELWDGMERLRLFHIGRILILLTLVLGWRWSVWLTVVAYLAVYIPNPWITGSIVNTFGSMVFLSLIVLITLTSQRQFLLPWRNLSIQS